MSRTQSQHNNLTTEPTVAAAGLALPDEATMLDTESDDVLVIEAPAVLEDESQLIDCTTVIDADSAGLRLDQVAADAFSQYSRERLKNWINQGDLTLNGKASKPKQRCVMGDVIQLTTQLVTQTRLLAEPMPIDVIFEDDAILVINKPAGLVVHPGAGNSSGTLVNGLLAYNSNLQLLSRAGLVHRIDKDTTGLLVVAKTIEAQHSLVKQLQEKSVYRVYAAIVQGRVIAGGTIDAPIARHPTERVKMAVRMGGRVAVTHYRVVKHYDDDLTVLQVQLETGRTHQIRVHMASIGFPLLGDSVYNTRNRVPKGLSPEMRTHFSQFTRQALHAKELGLTHPVTGERMLFAAPLPADWQALATELDAYYR